MEEERWICIRGQVVLVMLSKLAEVPVPTLPIMSFLSLSIF